jgi:hypothetical protein
VIRLYLWRNNSSYPWTDASTFVQRNDRFIYFSQVGFHAGNDPVLGPAFLLYVIRE